MIEILNSARGSNLIICNSCVSPIKIIMYLILKDFFFFFGYVFSLLHSYYAPVVEAALCRVAAHCPLSFGIR